jgi:hypothetical protein
LGIAVAALVVSPAGVQISLENCQAATRSCLNRAVNIVSKTTGNPQP